MQPVCGSAPSETPAQRGGAGAFCGAVEGMAPGIATMFCGA